MGTRRLSVQIVVKITIWKLVVLKWMMFLMRDNGNKEVKCKSWDAGHNMEISSVEVDVVSDVSQQQWGS